jgi:hypothetical protein
MAVMFRPRLSKPPTEADRIVIFWTIFIALVGLGVVCLYIGYRAPVERAQDAAKLIQSGYGLIGAGIVMLVIRRFFCGFCD